ncbi:FAD-dependent oxidoreductase [Deltaproteobacteria bacterium]|nr:FAD-dependent oxidoreductase [Deltaproteobacteria bacterium]
MSVREAKVVVVGAGINGLCTAWQLAGELDGADVVMVDQFAPGHSRGSSHGEERIIRSTYESVDWVLAMQRAQGELWPALAADLARPLLVPGSAVFWGPETGPIAAYSEAVRAIGSRVEEIDDAEARARFPHMSFAGAERVLHDHSAGLIAAGETVRGLEAWLQARGVERRVGKVTALEDDGSGVKIVVDGEVSLRAEVVVVTAGPWVGELVREFASRVIATRQDVGYWEMDVAPGRTPAWVYLGDLGLEYGMPALGGGVMKAAMHRQVPEAPGGDPGRDDPNVIGEASEARLVTTEAHLRDWFLPGPGRRIRGETCFFTNAPGDQFLLEASPASPRVLVVSACSGHAFKLAPLTGEAAARWAVARVS